MMVLFLTLVPASLPQVPHGRIVSVIYKFSQRTTIPGVESEIYLRANIFGTSDNLDELQDNRMKNNRLLRVLLLSFYAVKLH